jgi:ubiquinone/menaquinone biosynthesis C-methylase UbiE
MVERKNRVCPVGISGTLDNRFRRWLQNPRKILSPYIEEGMTVLDFGCGPGFFSIDLAQMVGKTGRVIACDLQEGMLLKLGKKVSGTELERRITLHKCQSLSIGVSEQIDFVLAFYMVHEIPNPEEIFREIAAMLKPDGQVLVVEPPFHVSKAAFDETIRAARRAGLTPIDHPKLLFSRAVVLKRG